VTESYRFSASEQPSFDGGPYSPAHHPLRRFAYLIVGLIVALCAQLGHALTLVNLPYIAGGLGIDQAQSGWLLAAYVAANISGNLLLVRARIRYGIPGITIGVLTIYALLTALQLSMPSFALALAVRMASGLSATTLLTIAIYCMMQIVQPKQRPLALLLAVSFTQLAVPLARLVPVTVLTVGPWQGVYFIELSVTLLVISLLIALPLPPSIRGHGFQPLDFATYTLTFAGLLLLCGAIATGRAFWWTDTPWIGMALITGTSLLILAFLIEHYRTRPLLLTKWIGTKPILRYLAIALLMRFIQAEQTYGTVGLLNASGLNNDQLHKLFLIVLLAMVLGIAVAALTWTPPKTFKLILAAALVITVGAWLDTGANNLTRPTQLYLSQALLGFGACMFIGPALLFGFGQVLQLGRDHFVSMVVMFGMTQNLGGLLGASLLGTFQVVRTKAHAAALSEHLVSGEPEVAARLASKSTSNLYGALQREASVLAFNDVFMLVAVIASLTAVYIGYPIMSAHIRALYSKLPPSK
jgi:MFS family permease